MEKDKQGAMMHILAKLTAFRDISENCRREGGKNYIIHEREICEALGIKTDFRSFNGDNGYNSINNINRILCK